MECNFLPLLGIYTETWLSLPPTQRQQRVSTNATGGL